MTEAIYPYINSLAAYSMIISAILVIKDRNKIKGAYAVVGFIVCVLLYLLIDFVAHPLLKWILVIGPSLLPFAFWMMARMILMMSRYPDLPAINHSYLLRALLHG